MLFLEGPTDCPFRGQVDLQGDIEGRKEIAENDAGALGRLVGAHAIPEAEAAQAHVEEELRLRIGGPIVSNRCGCRRADCAGATKA